MAPEGHEQQSEHTEREQQATLQQVAEAAAAAQNAAFQAHQESASAELAARAAAAHQQSMAVQAGNTGGRPSILGKLLNKPTPYDGTDKYACNTFIAQVQLYMSGNEESFPTEETKVLFAATYLRGKAFAWLEPRLVKQTDPLLHNFQLFCTELQRNLGDPDQENTMVRKLKTIKQTTSAATYRSEFDSITQYLTWDEAALKSYYYDGLRPDVKDALSYIPEPPTNFHDYQDLTIRIDTRLYERRQESRPNFARHMPPPRHKVPPAPRPAYRSLPPPRPVASGVPMDLDATRNNRFKPLTPAERTRRMENNLSC